MLLLLLVLLLLLLLTRMTTMVTVDDDDDDNNNNYCGAVAVVLPLVLPLVLFQVWGPNLPMNICIIGGGAAGYFLTDALLNSPVPW